MKIKKKIGLFFGSFNPVHNGHMALANYFKSFTDLDEVWFVVSPQNPLKKRGSLIDPWIRLEMLNLAIGNKLGYKASDEELYLPKPSYTSVTLARFNESYPTLSFALIMGSDNLCTLPSWHNTDFIINNYPIYVYPRPGSENADFPGANIIKVNAPLIEISSSFIRDGIKKGLDLSFFVPQSTYDYIIKEQLYI